MNVESIKTELLAKFDLLMAWAISPQSYVQLVLVVVALCLALLLSKLITRYIAYLNQGENPNVICRWLGSFENIQSLLYPLCAIFLMGLLIGFSNAVLKQDQLLYFTQSILLILLVYRITNRYVSNGAIRFLMKWVVMPAMVLRLFGWLVPLINYLDSVQITLGNIEFSLLATARTLVLGTFLFWLGRTSNSYGQQIIRSQESLDRGTREIFAKLFEILLITALFILLLQIMGINLTTLAVFGGAIGVGLGFGLQSIASNFISGIIILLDRSLSVGDYIELEDGRQGQIRDLSMRSATVETFDGKDIVIPNETFISSSFTNWTHKNTKQRYSLELQVAYDTDLNTLFPMLVELVSSHPQIISGEGATIEELPDVEIAGFGDSGIDLQIEFWMDGIDDGRNRVAADLYLMIWQAFRDQNIEIPYPQREVRFVKPEKVTSE